MLKAVIRLSSLLFAMVLSKTVFACLVTIAYAHPVGSEVRVNAHSYHVGPPQQMIATFSYTGSDGRTDSLKISPRIEQRFNVYVAKLPKGASNISVSVNTGVGVSCGSQSVTAPFYEPAFWHSQLRPFSGGCELTIQTIGTPGIYVPWYYGGALAWWSNERNSDYFGIPVFNWSKQFLGADCSQVGGIYFKIMGDRLDIRYEATPSAQNG